MSELTTDDVIRRFNESFVRHDPEALSGLVAQDCVMESVGPAPDGTRYEGRDACLRFWQELANDPNTSFEPEEIVVAADRATIRWRARIDGIVLRETDEPAPGPTEIVVRVSCRLAQPARCAHPRTAVTVASVPGGSSRSATA